MIKYKQRSATTFTTDASGRRIAHVSLSGTQDRCKLLAEDLERILSEGYSPWWSSTSTGGRHRYVLVKAANPRKRERSLTVARLVMEAGKGQVVKYADGDRLNLLPENLLVRKGRAIASVAGLSPGKGVQRDAQEPRAALAKRAKLPTPASATVCP
jgi:hypothetical protein